MLLRHSYLCYYIFSPLSNLFLSIIVVCCLAASLAASRDRSSIIAYLPMSFQMVLLRLIVFYLILFNLCVYLLLFINVFKVLTSILKSTEKNESILFAAP